VWRRYRGVRNAAYVVSDADGWPFDADGADPGAWHQDDFFDLLAALNPLVVTMTDAVAELNR